MISLTIASSPPSEVGISMARPWCLSARAYKEDVAFFVADEVPAGFACYGAK